MSITTLPSKPTTVVDVPEVTSFSGEFLYNFFTRDERVNASGPASQRLLQKPFARFDLQAQASIEFSRNVPRYIKFSWTPVTIGNRNNESSVNVGLKFQRQYLVDRISIQQNFEKIYTEDDFHNTDFTIMHLQSNEFDSQVKRLVKVAYNITKPGSRRDSVFYSPQDRMRVLNSRTSREVSAELIAAGENLLGISGIRLEGEGPSDSAINRQTAGIKSVKTSIQLNNSVMYDVLNFASFDDNEISPLSQQLNPAGGDWRDDLYSMQTSAQALRSHNNFSVDEYDSEIQKLVSMNEVVEDNYEPVLQPIGYIIEKFEISSTNQVTFVDRLFVEDPVVNTSADIKVRYGANYFYEIRTVAYIEIQGYDLQNNKIIGAGFLVSSKPLRTEVVRCIETKPPPPPTDFIPTWDYNVRRLRLTWNFPVDTQRDVKYFQVFRRASVYEPFQLIKMYDFDDSNIRTPPWTPPNGETGIDHRVVERLSAPLTYFLDNEFTKESKQIYAICAIDAHGYSSNYSMQFEVSFDRERNKLIISLLSVPNAPKAYPNTFINVDTFVDTIKDEGHTKVEVVFNPEYLKVVNSKGHDLGLLKTGIEDSYRIQLINIDLQEQKTFTIKLVDNTATSFFTRGASDTFNPEVSVG